MPDVTRISFVFLLICLSQAAAAQSQRTEHTYQLDDPGQRPAATLDDVSWLVGNWSARRAA